MDLFLVILAGIGGLALGILAGLKVGERIRGRASWRYWSLNAVAFVLGVLVEFAGFVYGSRWLQVGGLTLLAGTFTGLKYGYGAVPVAGRRGE